MVVETVPPAAVTEHLSRYMDVLRTRGSSVHSLQEGIRAINFDLEQPHRHDFYQLLWFERGVGRYQIDFIERPLTDQMTPSPQVVDVYGPQHLIEAVNGTRAAKA